MLDSDHLCHVITKTTIRKKLSERFWDIVARNCSKDKSVFFRRCPSSSQITLIGQVALRSPRLWTASISGIMLWPSPTPTPNLPDVLSKYHNWRKISARSIRLCVKPCEHKCNSHYLQHLILSTAKFQLNMQIQTFNEVQRKWHHPSSSTST